VTFPLNENNVALFLQLLADFPVLISQADRLRTGQPQIDPLAIKIAVIGYGLYRPRQEWGEVVFEYVHSFVYEEPSPLEPVAEEYRESATVFAALGLGALLGSCNDNRITDEECGRAEFDLVFFIIQRAPDIHAVYAQVSKTSPMSLISPYNSFDTDDES